MQEHKDPNFKCQLLLQVKDVEEALPYVGASTLQSL